MRPPGADGAADAAAAADSAAAAAMVVAAAGADGAAGQGENARRGRANAGGWRQGRMLGRSGSLWGRGGAAGRLDPSFKGGVGGLGLAVVIRMHEGMGWGGVGWHSRLWGWPGELIKQAWGWGCTRLTIHNTRHGPPCRRGRQPYPSRPTRTSPPAPHSPTPKPSRQPLGASHCRVSEQYD